MLLSEHILHGLYRAFDTLFSYYILLVMPRVYKRREGECRTVHILRVTAVRTVHDLCNDIHV